MSGSTARRIRQSSLTDSLSVYLKDIGAYPMLDRAAEESLGRRIREGDTLAVDQLVCANLRFVVSIAKKYQHQGVSLADLINEGNIGLMRAAEKFDETKGVKFISYAVWWVRQAIIQALAENGHAVRIPLSRAGALYRVGRRTDVLRQELGREPTRQELAQDLAVSEADIAVMLPSGRAQVSLDTSADEGDDKSLLDVLADPEGLAPDSELLENNLADSIERALASLRPREAQVLRLYFGFDGNDPLTLERISEQLGITRERVRQIKEKALSRLRRSSHGVALAAFTER